MKNWKIGIFLSTLFILNSIVWGVILFDHRDFGAQVYFLDVGQGDSQLVKADGANFLIDAGRNDVVLDNLEKILPFYGKKIDLIFLSHAQQDHAGGVFELIKNYGVGAVIYNGEKISVWEPLSDVLNENKIPYFSLAAGDSVGFGENVFKIIWPESGFLEGKHDENDASLVVKFENGTFSSLFAGDISSKAEKALTKILAVKADILKVPHHGSKYSSSAEFLEAVSPKISVIEVGKNSYGHPTDEALERLKNVGSQIFRTDRDGIVKVFYQDGFIKVSNSSVY
ncbi:MAG: internalization-related competence protein ComEC/Rec2 protein [Candidatus Wolfebacteria bacterium GW2011_GWC1_43_10]|uniref:Internalization-related competence protein ComEC/Rec2 protein n=2 Tax=Candidatus Wolfeibacteriota TaxID=1752735 RepID=A0A0G1F8B4_9BACT|nr:MAG: internalization-related competence protein ComEC/Rec2 protein [Candidatus Wolfebacteria bacterium GW2011_GWC1_43_10]OGM90041.1 MAG: hypothetical protein A2108_01730 [Candidatus Wolfebacteria bacterium GWA1_42_9]